MSGHLPGGLAIGADEDAHILLGEQELAAGQAHDDRRARLAAGEELCQRSSVHVDHGVPAQAWLSAGAAKRQDALSVSHHVMGGQR